MSTSGRCVPSDCGTDRYLVWSATTLWLAQRFTVRAEFSLRKTTTFQGIETTDWQAETNLLTDLAEVVPIVF